jgi:opacity protein-like surface antigen
MRKLLLGSVALFALSVGSPAVAADMPVKARPLPPPIYNWSGCYGGGFVGYGTARTRTTVTETFPAFSPFYGLAFNDDTHLSGALGGFDFGCQWQGVGGWLIGVEVDGAATNKAGQRLSLPPFLANQVHDTKESWMATARLRLGYGWDKWLFYVTGGGAWAGVEESLFFTPVPAISIHQKQTRSGWTVGAGWEYALGYGWSIKSEFLYMDFGTKNSWAPASLTHVAIDVELQQYVYKVGLNYKFDWGKAPVAVMAKY